jgi:hypothetical protein
VVPAERPPVLDLEDGIADLDVDGLLIVGGKVVTEAAADVYECVLGTVLLTWLEKTVALATGVFKFE